MSAPTGKLRDTKEEFYIMDNESACAFCKTAESSLSLFTTLIQSSKYPNSSMLKTPRRMNMKDENIQTRLC